MTSRPNSSSIDLEPLATLVPGPPIPTVAVSGTGTFASAFDVDRAVFTAAAAANAAFGATSLQRERAVALCAGRATVDGDPVPAWADLSGYYDTADGGQIQFHCNFPHHAAGVVRELECDPTPESVRAAVLQRDPAELEASLIAAGMIAADRKSTRLNSSH